MAKFTLHFKGGDFTGESFRSKQKAIDKANSTTSYRQVCEEYIAPSPWSGKLSKHGRKIYENLK